MIERELSPYIKVDFSNPVNLVNLVNPVKALPFSFVLLSLLGDLEAWRFGV